MFDVTATRVRKYASPEPSAANGTEEDSPIPSRDRISLGRKTSPSLWAMRFGQQAKSFMVVQRKVDWL